MNDILDHTKKKMAAAIDHLKEELRAVRTGRANPGMVEGVTIEVYGSPMRLKEIATINSPEPRQIVITPFDPNNKGAISNAIQKANLGFNPMVDGNVVRIKIPPMDEQMRKEMGKLCHKRCEETKVRVREARREGNEAAKKRKNEGSCGEDDVKRIEKQIQDLTDKACKEAEDLTKKKEQEISAV